MAPRYNDLASTRRSASNLHQINEYFDGKRQFGELTLRARIFLIRVVVMTTIRNLFQPKVAKIEGEGESGDSKTVPEQTLKFIYQAVAERQSVSAVQQHIDGFLYQAGYLASDPFVRLELRAFFCNVKVDAKNTARDYEVAVYPSLLLHRDGTALLTFGFRLPAAMSSDELSRMMTASELFLDECEVARELLDRAAALKDDRLIGPWDTSGEIREGTTWAKLVQEDRNVSLVDIFRIFHSAILSIARPKRFNADWLCFPSIFIENIECCGSRKKWMARHSSELARMLSRTAIGERFSSTGLAKLIEPDYSLRTSESFFIPGGCTVEINWSTERRRSRTEGYFHRLVVTEDALVKYWTLRSLASSIQNDARTRRSLERIQVRLLHAVENYHNRHFNAITADENSEVILKCLAGDLTLKQIESRINTLQQLISMREANRAASRANRLAATAAIVALILGLPAIEQSLGVLREVDPSGFLGFIRPAIEETGLSNKSLAWVVYLVLIGIGALILVARPIRLRRSIGARLRGERTAGVRWPGPNVNVEVVNDEGIER